MRNKRFKDAKDHMYRQFSPCEPYPQVPPYLLLQRILKLRSRVPMNTADCLLKRLVSTFTRPND